MIFVHPNWMLMATDTYNRLESMINKFQGMQNLYLTEIGQIWPKIAEKSAKIGNILSLATQIICAQPSWCWWLHIPKTDVGA